MDSTVVAVFGIQPFRIGGVESFVRELARQLEPRGVRLAAVFSALPAGPVAEYLRAPNLEIAAVPALETSARASVGPLAALLRRYKPQVVHFQFVDFVGLLPWVARLCGARKIVFTAQGSNPLDFEPRRAPLWKRWAVRVINAPLSAVIGVSDYTRGALAALDTLPKERFRVIYSAVQPPSLDDARARGSAFRKRFAIPEDRELITQVSWIIPEKGVADLLDAAMLVLARRPQTHFAIVGRGACEAEYKRHAADLGIADAVTWTGLVGNPMEEGVYAAADVFCLPSCWQEAFGWVIAEAMAFEKPVVATRVGGIPEVVEDGVTGLLVPPRDPEALAEALLRLLDDAELRGRMGAAGRRRVEGKFNLERNVTALIGEYGL